MLHRRYSMDSLRRSSRRGKKFRFLFRSSSSTRNLDSSFINFVRHSTCEREKCLAGVKKIQYSNSDENKLNINSNRNHHQSVRKLASAFFNREIRFSSTNVLKALEETTKLNGRALKICQRLSQQFSSER